MGCCISKTTARSKPPRPSGTRRPLYYAGASPPQPLYRPIPSPLPLEEESVKEVVISEISPLPPPSPTPTVPESLPPLPTRPQPSPPRTKLPSQVRQPQTPRKRDAVETDILISKLEQAADVVSEYSDMYTMSGSLSVSTTATTGATATLAERKDSEVTSKVSRPVARPSPNKPPRKRPPLVGGEERGNGASPSSRRVQQASPERGRKAVVGQGREPGGVRRSAGPARRDSGGISRRSCSPAQGRDGDGVRGEVGKSPCKRTGSVGNRSSGPGMENGWNPQRCQERDPEEEVSSAGGAHEVDDEGNDCGVVSKEGVDDVGRGGNDNTASESLENPQVSLECFIFL